MLFTPRDRSSGSGGERAGAVIDFLAPDSQGRLSQEALLQPPSVLFPMGVKFNSRPKILVWLTVCFLALFSCISINLFFKSR